MCCCISYQGQIDFPDFLMENLGIYPLNIFVAKEKSIKKHLFLFTNLTCHSQPEENLWFGLKFAFDLSTKIIHICRKHYDNFRSIEMKSLLLSV